MAGCMPHGRIRIDHSANYPRTDQCNCKSELLVLHVQAHIYSVILQNCRVVDPRLRPCSLAFKEQGLMLANMLGHAPKKEKLVKHLPPQLPDRRQNRSVGWPPGGGMD